LPRESVAFLVANTGVNIMEIDGRTVEKSIFETILELRPSLFELAHTAGIPTMRM